MRARTHNRSTVKAQTHITAVWWKPGCLLEYFVVNKCAERAVQGYPAGLWWVQTGDPGCWWPPSLGYIDIPGAASSEKLPASVRLLYSILTTPGQTTTAPRTLIRRQYNHTHRDIRTSQLEHLSGPPTQSNSPITRIGSIPGAMTPPEVPRSQVLSRNRMLLAPPGVTTTSSSLICHTLRQKKRATSQVGWILPKQPNSQVIVRQSLISVLINVDKAAQSWTNIIASQNKAIMQRQQ